MPPGMWVGATRTPAWWKQPNDGNCRLFSNRESVRKSKLNTVCRHRSLWQKGANADMTFAHADEGFPGSCCVLANLAFPRCPAVYSGQASHFSMFTTEMAALVEAAPGISWRLVCTEQSQQKGMVLLVSANSLQNVV